MERWPGRQKRSTTDFPSALAAANGDPARPNARVDRRKGKHLICLAHFPSPLRSPLTLSAPAGSISLFLSRSDRFAFDTHGYVRAVRVENGGCQFLFLRSKDSRRVVAMPWYFGGYRTKRTRGYRGGCAYKNVDFLDDTKKNINKTSRRRGSGFFFLPRFFFFLVTLVEGEEAKGKRCRAGGKSRDLLNKRFFSIELSWLITCRTMCINAM